MDVKKTALVLSILLVLMGLIDLSNRLLFSAGDLNEQTKVEEGNSEKGGTSAVLLSIEEVKELLAWSDAKPKKAAVVVAVKPATVTPAIVAPKPDIRALVRAAVADDDSRHLIGDNLISLKGVFFDVHDFAVVEIENVITTKKQHFRARINQLLAGHELIEIGKTHIVIKNGRRNVRLRMFNKSR